MLFAPKNQKIIGLDISDTAVKLLELSGGINKGGKQSTKVKVEHYAVCPLPAGSVVEKNIIEPEAVADAISQAVRKSGTRTRRAAVAVGGSSTITKYISLPAGLSQRQLEQQVEVEAESHIPFPIEEVSLDFEVLGPKRDDPDMLNILLAAARSDIVDARVTALELAGLEAGVVDLEIFALENACSLLAHQMLTGKPGAKADRTKGPDDGKVHVAVVDVGSSTTSLTVLENGRPVYTRDQQFGGMALTEEIMQHYELSFEEAGFTKKSGKMPKGVTEEAYFAEVL